MSTPVSSRLPSARQTERRLRSQTDSELLVPTSLPHHTSSYHDLDMAPHKARLYQYFDLIEKEYDALHAENAALRARLATLQGGEADSTFSNQDVLNVFPDISKGSAKKGSGMQMGQKLRTALRGPPTRLVFKATDAERFRVVRRLDAHRDGVWHVAASTHNGLIASASADQTSCVWSLESGQCLASYTGHNGSVNCVSFCPRETSPDVILATASGDESAHVWRIPSGLNVSQSEEDDDKENNDGDNAESEGLRVKNPTLRLTGHMGVVAACQWLAGGNQLITASWDRTANIYDVERGEVLNILSGHEQELTHCAAHVSQKLVVTSSKDSTFRLWDFRETIQSVAVFQGHQDSVTSVAFAGNDRIVSGSDDHTVKVWDVRNMRSALVTLRVRAGVNRLAVSSCQGLLAIPLDNRQLRICDLTSNRLTRFPNTRCHNRLVTCAAWIDEQPGENLVTSGFDRIVATWKVAFPNKDKE